MTSKIEKLTSEQEALLPVVRDKWIRIGLSTEPADRERAEEGVRKAYKAAGLREPRMVWVGSPEAMTREIEPNLNSVRGQVYRQVRDQAWRQFIRPSRLADMAEFDFYRRVGLEGLEPAAGLMQVMEQICWWAPFEDTCILCERPTRLLTDNEGRLHSETGPAVEYSDGWSLYYWHGTTIPQEWVTGSPPTVSEALSRPNVEQRRCAAEILGWDRILGELDPEVVDKDPDPEIGTLLKVDLPDSPGEQFLRVRCGTGRDFVLPVPPDVKTAREANASTWGLDPHEYNPEVRT